MNATETALVKVRCPAHNVGMVQRPLEQQTPEQRFCGAWWNCPEPQCGCTILFESPELRAQLAEHRQRQQALTFTKSVPHELEAR